MRPSLTARRSCHTETPCTIRPNATINGGTWVGARKCSHTAAATTPKAKPASPVTKAAAKVPAANKVRSAVWEAVQGIPHRGGHGYLAAAIGQGLASYGLGED